MVKNKEECLRRGVKWTPAMEERYYKLLLIEKRQVFEDLEIPFPEDVEAKYKKAVENKRPNIEIYLDNLCHDIIAKAYEDYNQVLYDILRSKHTKNVVKADDIKKCIGKYGMQELEKAGLIIPIIQGKLNREYIIKECYCGKRKKS